jgi:hypothetical protein
MSEPRIKVFGIPEDLDALQAMLPEEDASKYPLQASEPATRLFVYVVLTPAGCMAVKSFVDKFGKRFSAKGGGEIAFRAGDPASRFSAELKLHAEYKISDDK